MTSLESDKTEITKFELNAYPTGFKNVLNLLIKSKDSIDLSIPILVVKGTKPGKTIAVFGGVQGTNIMGLKQYGIYTIV